MEYIESLTNSRVKKWVRLHHKKDRDQTGLFLVEGEHLIQEALKASAVETIITDTVSPFDFEPVIHVTDGIMKKISDNVSEVHLIAVCRQKQLIPDGNMKRVLLLDGIQDPGNMGTLIRTAVSFSFDAVYCSKDCCDLYNEKTIRSTQGALFHIPVSRCDLQDLVGKLKKEGFCVIATALDASEAMEDIHQEEHMAFILGNEGQGVRKELQSLADRRLRIEMHGFESLNVAVAGGIIMYRYRV